MASEIFPSGSEVTRRGVIRGAAVGGLTLPLLAACGEDEPSTEPAGSDSGTGGASGDGGAGGAGGARVAKADVPVGGGAVLAGAKVVVTQPAKGDFKAFTAVCTHQGCLVNKVADGKIQCPCHGSMYSVEDGSVVAGPAPSPLAEKSVTAEGDELVVA